MQKISKHWPSFLLVLVSTFDIFTGGYIGVIYGFIGLGVGYILFCNGD